MKTARTRAERAAAGGVSAHADVKSPDALHEADGFEDLKQLVASSSEPGGAERVFGEVERVVGGSEALLQLAETDGALIPFAATQDPEDGSCLAVPPARVVDMQTLRLALVEKQAHIRARAGKAFEHESKALVELADVLRRMLVQEVLPLMRDTDGLDDAPFIVAIESLLDNQDGAGAIVRQVPVPVASALAALGRPADARLCTAQKQALRAGRPVLASAWLAVSQTALARALETESRARAFLDPHQQSQEAVLDARTTGRLLWLHWHRDPARSAWRMVEMGDAACDVAWAVACRLLASARRAASQPGCESTASLVGVAKEQLLAIRDARALMGVALEEGDAPNGGGSLSEFCPQPGSVLDSPERALTERLRGRIQLCARVVSVALRAVQVCAAATLLVAMSVHCMPGAEDKLSPKQRTLLNRLTDHIADCCKRHSMDESQMQSLFDACFVGLFVERSLWLE